MFRDDLQKALKRPADSSAASKSAVAAYVGQNFHLTADGVKLRGEVLDSGADMDGDAGAGLAGHLRLSQPRRPFVGLDGRGVRG